MDIRSSDPSIRSVGHAAPKAVTSVELVWKMPPPVLPVQLMQPRRPRVTTGPVALPNMQDLAAAVRALADEASLEAAVDRLQRDARRLLGVTDALCVWIDWPRRIARTLTGRASAHVEDIVIETAGSGRRATLGSSILEPIGPTPARAVLALRKPSGVAFAANELAMIATLAAGIAPALDRLIAGAR
jgi:hypothetical protein